jgi:hypothetical protein
VDHPPAVTLSPEQFDRLLSAASGRARERPPIQFKGPLGFGDAGSGIGPRAIEEKVWQYLALGSPRLAYAVATGAALAPYFVNVRATFNDTSVTDVPNLGSDIKIVQDTLIDAMVIRTINQSVTANLNQFQAQSDFFYNFQSGLEATLDVQGAPRYSDAPTFVPLSTLADMVSGQSHWPGGWVLTYQQQLFMSFHASVALPTAPILVVVTFRCWTATGQAFVEMSNREAMENLEKNCGIVLPDAYKTRVLSR